MERNLIMETDTREFILRHEGKEYTVRIIHDGKRRVMRVHSATGNHSVLAGLSKYENWSEAARYLVEREPALR